MNRFIRKRHGREVELKPSTSEWCLKSELSMGCACKRSDMRAHWLSEPHDEFTLDSPWQRFLAERTFPVLQFLSMKCDRSVLLVENLHAPTRSVCEGGVDIDN